MPVVDWLRERACCLAVGLRQLTKTLKSPSFTKSAELKRPFIRIVFVRPDSGSVEYVLRSDDWSASLIWWRRGCIADSKARGGCPSVRLHIPGVGLLG
jgi:hypothetical protein